MRQSVTTQKGVAYDLSVDLRSRPGTAITTNTVEVWFAGQKVATVDPESTTAWKTYHFTLYGTGSSALVEFREVAADNNGLGALIDNVSLFAITPATYNVDIKLGASANIAPVISSNGGGDTAAISVKENQTAVATVKAIDADGGSVAPVYAIKQGGDGALFAINAATGVLSFKSAPDYEAPSDLDRNNAYQLTVVASDAFGAKDEQALTITVSDVAGVTLTGTSAANILTGTAENDTLKGMAGNDRLDGGAANDVLIGGAGQDSLIGGQGADIFRYLLESDSRTGAANRDIIMDFEHGVDKIDLSALDANTGLLGFGGMAGDQAFSLLANAGANFTGQGQLRYLYQVSGGQEYTVVQGNNNVLSGADFEIALLGHHIMTAADFIL